MPAIQQKPHVSCADCLGQFHHAKLSAYKWKTTSRPGGSGPYEFQTQPDDVVSKHLRHFAEVAAIYGGEGPGPIAKPKWVVDVSGEEYAPPEPKAETGDEYYVPLGSELQRIEAEQTLIERQEALQIKRRVLGEEHPDVLSSMKDLAYLYYQQRRYGKVETLVGSLLETSRRVLGEEDPSTLELMIGLAFLRATCPVAELRDGAKAVELATKACELTKWKNPIYLDTLAAAYAEAGDFEAAVKWQKEAIDLLTEEQRARWQGEFESRLKLYQAGKPYRESSSESR